MHSPTLFCEMFDAQRIKRIDACLMDQCFCYWVSGYSMFAVALINWDTRWHCHTPKILLLSCTPVTGPTVAHSPLYLEMTCLVSKSSMLRNKLHICGINEKNAQMKVELISLLPGIPRREVEIHPVPDKCDPRVGLNAAVRRRCCILRE